MAVTQNNLQALAGRNDNLFIVLNIDPENTWLANLTLPFFWDLSIALKKFLVFAEYYLTQALTNTISYLVIADFLQKLLQQHFLSSYDPIVIKASNWIDNYFADRIDLTAIAHYCCLSISQLQHRFNKIIGQGIGTCWRLKRLQQAQLFLNISTMTIETIAYTVGYENSAAFSRSFSRQFGLSPSQWRNLTLSANNTSLNDK